MAGGTGLVGGHLCGELAAKVPPGQIVALVRQPSSALPVTVQQRVCDFRQLDTLAPIAADSVFCALGTTNAKAGSPEAFRQVDYEAVLALGRFGRRCGARQFILISSVDASPRSSSLYLRVKGEAERDLALLGYPTLHIFRPSILIGGRPESRPGESLGIAFAKAIGWALIGPLKKYRGIDAGLVARAAAQAPAAEGVHIHQYEEIAALAAAR